MNSVDKLFKSKLEDHQLAPSLNAWEKLESNLSKKNRTLIWFRVAAVLALMGLLTVVVLNWNSSPEVSTLAKTDQPAAKNEKNQKPLLEEKNELVNPVVEKEGARKATRNRITTKPVENLTATESVPEIKEEEVLVETAVAYVVEEEKVQPTVVAEKKSIVLVYSLPTLPTQETETTVVAAVEEEAAQTGIQKIWEAAKDVKNSDNPWGDLREVKNELLALDFKKDKNKNSNN